jgi:hypothetical protein
VRTRIQKTPLMMEMAKRDLKEKLDQEMPELKKRHLKTVLI